MAAGIAVMVVGASHLAAATATLTARPGIESCEAHIAAAGASESIVPCGTAVEVAAHGTVGWIETASEITPYLTELSAGGSFAIPTLVPAGRLVFPPGHVLSSGERIRLVSLSPPPHSVPAQRLFVREITMLDATPRMPAGSVIALLLDARGNAIGASSPVTVLSGSTTPVWPDRPTRGAMLIAWLELPSDGAPRSSDRMSVRIVDDTGERHPDALVHAGDALFAAWYEVEGSAARLLLESSAFRVPEDNVNLARGTVALTRQALERLPSLRVRLGTLGDDIPKPREMTLSVARADRQEKTIRTLDVEPGGTYDVNGLPAAPLIVDLTIDEFVWQEHVDLTAGRDGTLDIRLDPLLVSGTLYAGGIPARGTIRFGQKNSPVVIETDEEGLYEVVLWQARRYIVEVVLQERRSMPPFSEEVQVTSSRTLDFRVPGNRVRAHVYDEASGKPVIGAEVLIRNRWPGELGARSSVVSISVDDDVTELPPQRTGMSEINVRAAGYAPAGPFHLTVDERLTEKTFDIPMNRSSDGASLLILLDGATPAAGAEMATFAGDRMTWHAAADETGRILIPESVTQIRAIVRHPGAASDVVVLGPLTPGQRLSLARAAPPLLVKAVDRQGRVIGPAAANVALWLAGGVRLTGAEAAFATWSLAATAPDGTFLAKGVGSRPVRILLTRRASPREIAAGIFDSLATTITYPWPAVAEIVVADE
jgi:hypothetical protein